MAQDLLCVAVTFGEGVGRMTFQHHSSSSHGVDFDVELTFDKSPFRFRFPAFVQGYYIEEFVRQIDSIGATKNAARLVSFNEEFDMKICESDGDTESIGMWVAVRHEIVTTAGALSRIKIRVERLTICKSEIIHIKNWFKGLLVDGVDRRSPWEV